MLREFKRWAAIMAAVLGVYYGWQWVVSRESPYSKPEWCEKKIKRHEDRLEAFKSRRQVAFICREYEKIVMWERHMRHEAEDIERLKEECQRRGGLK